jgi:hypothetical protein
VTRYIVAYLVLTVITLRILITLITLCAPSA